MRTDFAHFSLPAPSNETLLRAPERPRDMGFFTACCLKTEVFINRAADQPLAAALTGWMPRLPASIFSLPSERLRAARQSHVSPPAAHSRSVHA